MQLLLLLVAIVVNGGGNSQPGIFVTGVAQRVFVCFVFKKTSPDWVFCALRRKMMCLKKLTG
jgi:hypothetical protein